MKRTDPTSNRLRDELIADQIRRIDEFRDTWLAEGKRRGVIRTIGVITKGDFSTAQCRENNVIVAEHSSSNPYDALANVLFAVVSNDEADHLEGVA